MYLLPALPEAWKNGEITGIKARGNYEVSLRWKNGKVNKATITCQNAGNLTINYNGKQQKLSFGKGETKIVK